MIDLEPILLHLPLDPPLRLTAAAPPVSSLSVALVRVSSEERTAYGEAAIADPAVFADAVDFFADTLTHGSHRDFGVLWQRMMSLLAEHQPAPVEEYRAVLSAIDMALWDLAGQELGVPCHRLLGGSRTRQIDCYASGLFADDPGLEEAAKRLRKRFGAIQLTLTGDVTRDLRATKLVRLAAGDEAPLLVDAAGVYTDLEEATRVGQALERAEVFWFEEALPDGRWEDYRALRRTIGPALAAGRKLTSLTAFGAALDAEALDVVVADLRRCGGLSAGRRVADRASLQGARVTFHTGLSPLAQLTAAQLVTAYAHAGPIQVLPHETALAELVQPAPVFKNGFLRVPEGPGLGATVSEDFLDQYRVELPSDE